MSPTVTETGTSACPSCGESLEPSARFCEACGEPTGVPIVPDPGLDDPTEPVEILRAAAPSTCPRCDAPIDDDGPVVGHQRVLRSVRDRFVSGRVTRWFNGQMQYTWSRVCSDTNGVAAFPANDYDLSGEWARADFDRRHPGRCGGHCDGSPLRGVGRLQGRTRVAAREVYLRWSPRGTAFRYLVRGDEVRQLCRWGSGPNHYSSLR